jgi:ABC-type lipoprotein export system ATPase subunit
VTHDAELARRTRRTVHMADGQILDGTLDRTAVDGTTQTGDGATGAAAGA